LIKGDAMKKNIILALVCFVNLLLSSQIVQAQWEECNNGFHSYTVLLIVLNGNNIFAGTDSECVLLSTKNGDNCVRKDSGYIDEKSYTLIEKDIFTLLKLNSKIILTSKENVTKSRSKK
jgi:hypothetical protein